MKYISVTHVDSVTGVPGYKAPMFNGPKFPDIKGLQIEWADESRWPIIHPDDYPKFYGTCDDDAVLDIPGFIVEVSKETYDNLYSDELRARLPSEATPRQLRLALFELGYHDQVEAYIEALPEPQKTKVKISWEYATIINKNDPIVSKLVEELGFTEEQLDELFIKARSIETNPFAEEQTAPEEPA